MFYTFKLKTKSNKKNTFNKMQKKNLGINEKK